LNIWEGKVKIINRKLHKKRLPLRKAGNARKKLTKQKIIAFTLCVLAPSWQKEN